MPTLNYDVMEGVPRGTLIGNVKTDWRLIDKYPSDVLDSLRLSVAMATSDDASHDALALNEISGDLTTLADLDREWLCAANSEVGCDVMSLTVSIKPLKYYDVIRVNVRVIDINDNAPAFPAMGQSYIEWAVRENVAVGTRLLLPSANDLDIGVNSVQRYELQDDSGHFALNVTRSGDVTTPLSKMADKQWEDVYLVIVKSLDRETGDFYSLTVVAWDGGEIPRSGSLRVHVTVLDSNDHAPICDLDIVEGYVSEYATPGKHVMRVKASDADQGINGHVTYSLDETANHGEVFSIDAETGDITLAGRLDHEITAKYDFYVTVSDGNKETALKTFCRVVVYVTDENDNSPVIGIKTLDGHSDIVVRENLPAYTIVAIVTVSDADQPANNGKVSCSMISSGGGSHFTLIQASRGEYQLLTNASLDSESHVTYNISITCQDWGQPSLSVTHNVSVTVDDINDHAPQFTSPIYKVQLKENNPEVVDLVTITATDLDLAPDNRLVRYSLRNVAGVTDDVTLSIEAVGGQVRSRIVFDYEQQAIYRYIVEAVDGGTPAKTSKVLLVLEITDVNDNAPICSESNYTFSVSRHAPHNTVIGNVKATDADSYPYNKLLFNLDRGSTNLFTIDSRNGSIYTRRSLAKELLQQFYQLKVTVSNPGFSEIKSTCNVTVVVLMSRDETTVLPLVTANFTTPVATSVTMATTLVDLLTDVTTVPAMTSLERLHVLLVSSDVIILAVLVLLLLLIVLLLVCIIRCCILCRRKRHTVPPSKDELLRAESSNQNAANNEDVLTALNSLVRLGVTLNRLEKERALHSDLLLPLYPGRVSRSCDISKSTRSKQVTCS